MATDTPVAVGERVPNRTVDLVRPDGTSEPTSLDDLVGETPVLLAFYTADFSPDCVDQWCEFRDFEWFTASEEVRVVGASKSSPSFHRRFIDRLDLEFPLYADTNLELAGAFGVTYRAFRLFHRARRSCFLVDGDRRVRYRWLGEHWLDPTRSVPPADEVHEGVREALAAAD